MKSLEKFLQEVDLGEQCEDLAAVAGAIRREMQTLDVEWIVSDAKAAEDSCREITPYILLAQAAIKELIRRFR